ncbi:LysR family transcriptional regulator, partial [Klebsiella quasipneumoniae]|uniref:LysR family transcriptional regulator n=1 Tax=Klebsiella quasipneumoniae TaxID=1463165 RepID=UPI00129961FD|nr:LysR family transcriptional regulator [Klebsiella quasipneumoniae]
MTLHQLRYIVELSRHNSISAAAQTLEISQPSLSTAIKDLEKEFHITLLERNRHGISFTGLHVFQYYFSLFSLFSIECAYIKRRVRMT